MTILELWEPLSIHSFGRRFTNYVSSSSVVGLGEGILGFTSLNADNPSNSASSGVVVPTVSFVSSVHLPFSLASLRTDNKRLQLGLDA
jgi:hypothetical protein